MNDHLKHLSPFVLKIYETLCPRTSLVLASRGALLSKEGRDAAEAHIIHSHRKSIVHRNHSFIQHHNFLPGRLAVETASLAYSIKLKCGIPYMVTANIDVEDGLVNVAIGILRHIGLNTDLEEEERESNKIKLVRLWIDFPLKDVGKLARVKSRPHVISKFHYINGSWMWTSVHLRTATINISAAAKCKHKQFPKFLAGANTVHKSQGATFDEIFYDNNKSQHNRLAYVGLRRVKTLKGFYLTNNKNLIFNLAKRTTAPNIKEINDEYLRLDRYLMKTFVSQE
ncbi:hypothetical protein AVEN_127314-1 [Araneus ventricosus]|uniref:ATP-dependent DNA helicase PIF1 n=1 Tax=Araneus ventricosus TaxID=182803 RepID=A0A4Y2TEL3_ARAVE|nr:hypothetical protein AVEN_127314-1 [Araneus ventricosus]